MLLLVLVSVSLRIPWVQQRVAGMVRSSLESSFGTRVELGEVSIELPARAVLSGLKIHDEQGLPAIAVESVSSSLINFSFWRLILRPRKEQVITIAALEIQKPRVQLYKRRRDGVMNLDFLGGKEKSPKDTVPSKRIFTFRLDDLRIVDGAFSYADSTQPDSVLAEKDKMNFDFLDIKDIRADFSVGLEKSKIISGRIKHLSARDAHCGLVLDTLNGNFELHDTMVFLDPYRGARKHMKADLRGMYISAGNSRVSFDAVSVFDDLGELFSLDNEKIADLHFRPSHLDFRFLRFFAGQDFPLEGTGRIEGDVSWGLMAIRGKNVKLGLGPNSKVLADIELYDYIHPDCFTLNVNFHPSVLDFAELYQLLPMLDLPVAGIVGCKGHVTGTLEKLSSKDFFVQYQNSTRFRTRFRLYHLTSADELLIDLNFKESQFTLGELHTLLPGASIPRTKFADGPIQTQGSFVGGPYDFVINAELQSEIGNVTSLLHMRTPPLAPDYLYEAELKTENLRFNRLGVSEVFDAELLNFTGTASGRGFRFSEMDVVFSGNFDHSVLYGYQLDQLRADSVRVRKETVSGDIALNDKEGDGDLKVNLDLHSEPHVFEFIGDLDKLDLNHYGLWNDTLLLTTGLNLKLTGDSADNLEGKAKFFLLHLDDPTTGKSADIQNFSIKTVENQPGRKNIALTSSVADGRLEGEFNFADAASVLKRISKEVGLIVQNNDSLTRKYYDERVIDTTGVVIRYALDPHVQANALFDFLKIPLYVGEGLNIHGDLSTGEVDQLHLSLQSDTLAAGGVGFSGTHVAIDFTKDPRENSVIGVGDIRFSEIAVSKGLRFQEVRFEPTMLNNSIEFWLTGNQTELNNSFRLNAVTEFLEDGIYSRINPTVSVFNIGDKVWKVDNLNRIISKDEKLYIRNLNLTDGEGLISAEGVLGDSTADKLAVNIRNLSLQTISDLYAVPPGIAGRVELLSAEVSSAFHEMRLTTLGKLSDFRYKSVDSVDVVLTGYYDGKPKNNFAHFQTDWAYHKKPAFRMQGNYDFKDPHSPLEARVDSSDIPLEWIEPFSEPEVRDLKGRLVISHIDVRGRPDSIELNGKGRLVGEAPGKLASMHVDYFNQTFYLADNSTIEFNQNVLKLDTIHIFDSEKRDHRAVLSGEIRHYGFRDLLFNVDVHDIRDFTIINTTKKDNDLFYGKLIVSDGFATVSGNLKKVEISADVATGKGTTFNIPITDYEASTRPDFIHFVSAGSAQNASGQAEREEKSLGFSLALRVHATPDALARIIFDEQVGDIIEATGEGNITLAVDDEGEFSMFGGYEIQKGNYLFTSQNVVSKKFEIQPGGHISWTGDPYDANLALDAAYRLSARIGTLWGTENTQRVPVSILMNMKGLLSKPDISLALRLDQVAEDDYSGLGSYFRNIQNDAQELNKQVVSLLVFGRFAPATGVTNSAGSATAGTDTKSGIGIGSSLSELVSNQINYWLSQALKNENLGVQISTNQFNDIQIGLRAHLFGDKVTVERNGTVINNQSGQLSIGNISVQIRMLPTDKMKNDSIPSSLQDGQLVMEVFNRELVGVTTITTNTTGVGVFYKKDFETLSEFFGIRKKKKAPKGRGKIVE